MRFTRTAVAWEILEKIPRQTRQLVQKKIPLSIQTFMSAFGEQFVNLAERRHAVATVNGTAEVHLALIGAGVRKGDHAIVPDLTFAAKVNAVYHAGAIPVFVDVDADSWTLDPVQLARVFDTSGSGEISVANLGFGWPSFLTKTRCPK